jgi:hypothetical protein
MKSFKPGQLVTYRYKLTNASNFYKVLNDWGDGGVTGHNIAHYSDKNPRRFVYTGYVSIAFLGDRKYLRRTRSNENFYISLAFFYEKLDH